MKKYILSLVALFATFILSACGGGGSGSTVPSGTPTTADKAVELVEAGEIYFSPSAGTTQSFITTVRYKKNLNDNYGVEVFTDAIDISGCTIVPGSVSFDPSPVTLPGNANSTGQLTVKGKVDGACSNKTNYKLTGRTIVALGSSKTQETFEVTSEEATNGSETTPTGYTFFNANDPLVVSQANTESIIKVQLIKDNRPVPGKEVYIQAFDSKYGDLAAYSVTTDNAGYANFTYRSPASIIDLNGTSYTIRFEFQDENGGIIREDYHLSYAIGGGDSAVNPYKFMNPSTPVEVTAGNQEVAISVYVVDKNTEVGISNKIVEITTPQSGEMDSATKTTDDSGRVEFIYKAPATISQGSMTVKLRLQENGIVIEQPIEINFRPALSGGVQYALNNETNLTITAPNIEKPISIDVVDAVEGIGVPNVEVSITNIESTYGSISPATVKTDASGRATFTYTAPNTLINGSTTATLSVKDNNGNTISKQISITTIPPTGGGSQFDFTNATDLTITAPSVQKEITVDLIDAATGVGVADEAVNISVIDSRYGSISPSMARTDNGGRATFTYTAPDTLTAGQVTATLSHTDNNKVTITETVTITISPATSSEYAFSNITSPVKVTKDKEIKVLSVYVVDGRGVGVANQEVSIQTISDAKFGAITSAATVITDASGKASFTYEAPENIKDIDGQSTVVKVYMNNSGVTVETAIVLTFSKQDDQDAPPKPIVIIPNQYREINLTTNSQPLTMEVMVFEENSNAPYTKGVVKVQLDQKVLNGVDVGRFNEYNATVGANGIATFTYTGPQDLKSLIDNNDTNTTFTFFHEDNSASQGKITVYYKPDSDYIPANYFLNVESSDNDFTMGLLSLKSFTIYIKDDLGNAITDDSIEEINITSQNTAVGRLIETTSTNELDSLHYQGSAATNAKTFHVKTYKRSGLIPVEVIVKFKDANGDEQNLTRMVNIVVYSGPPTAMSIVYAGVEHNATLAKYVEKFVLTVTDAYNNPVNTEPYVSVGAIVEYAIDGSSTTTNRRALPPRLWHGTADWTGNLVKQGDGTALFEDNSPSQNVFRYVDINNDRLVVFGDNYVYEALGKWDIQSVSSNVLDLNDSYEGDDRNNLYFAVGHNHRQDLCANDGRQFVGTMRSNTYKVDKAGHAFMEFEYDYHLTGKDITVWANLSGFQADSNKTTRIGEAIKHTLRGYGLITNDQYTLAKGVTRVLTFAIHHEHVPEWYRNGHFGYSAAGTCTVLNEVIGSNDWDARDCRSTVVFIDLNVTNDTNNDCTITLDGIAVSPEFRSSNSW